MKKSRPQKPTLIQQNKDSDFSCISGNIRHLFLSGRKLTAREINTLTSSNDARKQISVLRKEGWNIVDLVRPDRTKLYWLATEIKQGELFNDEDVWTR